MPSHAQSFANPGTPQEQSRRRFLADATLAVGGIIGLSLSVPLLGSTIPESMLKADSVGGTWTDLRSDRFAAVDAKPGTPIEVEIAFDYADGYFKPAPDRQSVWAIKLSPAQAANFKSTRPDLFGSASEQLKYPAIVMDYAVFSPICPHLGCRVDWHADKDRFVCPCHDSQYGPEGAKLSGPAPRGLDPLPFREQSGRAQVTWIQYRSSVPDRVIVAYG